MAFEQKASFTKRLFATLLATSLLSLVAVVGQYFSSQNFLEGLREINFANKVLNLTTLALEGISGSERTLDKVLSSSDQAVIKYAYKESQKVVKRQINEAIALSEGSPEVKALLEESLRSLDVYEKSIDQLLKELKRLPLFRPLAKEEELKSQLVSANQYAMDTKESLRKVQILLEGHSGEAFSAIYENRFMPLIVATALSLVFIAFVLVSGLANINRLRRSVAGLTSATDAVAKGDLGYQAPIIRQDEFGALTNEFNRMVTQLKRAMERVTRVQAITAAFSEVLGSDQVFDIIIHQAIEGLGANTGAVVTLDKETPTATVQRLVGYESNSAAWPMTIPLTTEIPVIESINTRRAIFLESREEIAQRYPRLVTKELDFPTESIVTMPLMVGDEVLGGVAFRFVNRRVFTTEDREFLQVLAGQGAQALHRSQLYEAAKEAIQVRDDFLSIASHELKTPLTPLKLQMQTLARQVRKGTLQNMTPEQLMNAFESSDNQVNRLTSLIDDLLDVSRISSGKLTLNFESMNLAEMVEEVMANYSQQLKDTNSTLNVQLDRTLIGNFDRVRIEQVLINLLTNAAKYAPGKPIHVILKRAGNKAHLMVKDEGPGIAKVDQARIFERFERVRGRHNIGGLGLGLFISHQIVEAHQGTIRVESEVGEGATFIVELPV